LLVATDGAIAWMGRDRRRFRPNFLIEGVEGLAERTWPGSRLQVGDALLDVARVCKRCVITTIDPDSAAVDPDVLRRINAELEAGSPSTARSSRPAGWQSATRWS
jgi:uncharacterized protein YcbX